MKRELGEQGRGMCRVRAIRRSSFRIQPRPPFIVRFLLCPFAGVTADSAMTRSPARPGRTARPGPRADLPADADMVEEGRWAAGFAEPGIELRACCAAVSSPSQAASSKARNSSVIPRQSVTGVPPAFIVRSTHSSSVVRMRRSELWTLCGDRPSSTAICRTGTLRHSKAGRAADRHREAGPCSPTRRPARRPAGGPRRRLWRSVSAVLQSGLHNPACRRPRPLKVHRLVLRSASPRPEVRLRPKLVELPPQDGARLLRTRSSRVSSKFNSIASR